MTRSDNPAPALHLAGPLFAVERDATASTAEALAGFELRAAVPVTAARLAVTHASAYLRAVRDGYPRPLAESSGAAWHAGLWQSARLQAGAVLAAAAEATASRRCAGGSGAAFHHARRARGASGCVFNAPALAAIEALARGARRVIVIDADAGCGGGTHELIEPFPRIHQLDIAVSDVDRYAPGRGCTLDLVTRAADYLPVLRARLGALDALAHACDLCLYSAGAEPHERCPDLGLRGIDEHLLAARDRMVFEWCRRHRIPVAFVLAGSAGAGLPRDVFEGTVRLTLRAALAAYGSQACPPTPPVP